MPSTTSPYWAEGYVLPPNIFADRQFFQAFLTDIDDRLIPLEELQVSYQDTVEQLTTQALQTITASISQEIQTQRQTLEQIQEDAQAVLAAYEEISLTGVPAVQIRLTPTANFAPVNVQAGFDNLAPRVRTIEQAGYVTASQVYTRTQSDARYITPAQLAAAQFGTNQIAESGIGTINLADGAVTLQKMREMASLTLLANMEGQSARPQAIALSAPALRRELSDMPLIYRFSGADFNGLTQILVDLPAEFKSFRLLEHDLRSNNAAAGLVLRIGTTAGGAVDQGTNDYANILMGYSGGTSSVSLNYSSANWAFLRTINTIAGQSDYRFTDGSWGISWSCLGIAANYDSTNNRDNIVTRGHRRNAANGRINRLQIGFNAPLVNGGDIRIFGIR